MLKIDSECVSQRLLWRLFWTICSDKSIKLLPHFRCHSDHVCMSTSEQRSSRQDKRVKFPINRSTIPNISSQARG